MGVSDRYHFAWLTEAFAQFEAESGALAALGRERRDLDLWAFGEATANPPRPPIEWLRRALGADRTRMICFDKFPADPTVRVADLNALDGLPADACDVFTLFRASYFIAAPEAFLAGVRRIVRRGGLVLIDWLHGLSDAPVLNLYGGRPSPFTTTYADGDMIARFAGEFDRLLAHVNRPPWWANVEQPGTPLLPGERLRRLLGGGPRRRVTTRTYLETLRSELGRAGKYLIEPGLMEHYFKVEFRHARYFYPFVKKFNLYVLTVLRPVGK